MLVISTREFRDKQKSYLDKIDEGFEILIQRGKNKTYRIIPVSEDDIVMSKAELDSVIEQGLLDMKEGRTKRYTMEELREKIGI